MKTSFTENNKKSNGALSNRMRRIKESQVSQKNPKVDLWCRLALSAA